MREELVALAKLAEMDDSARDIDAELKQIPEQLEELRNSVQMLENLLAQERDQLAQAQALKQQQSTELKERAEGLQRARKKVAQAQNIREANAGERLQRLAVPRHLAAVIGVVVAFFVANVQEMLGGRWDLGPSPEMGTEEIRKMIGLFAIVQGFEASRYIGVRFAAERRISTMRIAQIVSTVVFVIFMVTLLLAFLPTPPGVPEDHGHPAASRNARNGSCSRTKPHSRPGTTACLSGRTSNCRCCPGCHWPCCRPRPITSPRSGVTCLPSEPEHQPRGCCIFSGRGQLAPTRTQLRQPNRARRGLTKEKP